MRKLRLNDEEASKKDGQKSAFQKNKINYSVRVPLVEPCASTAAKYFKLTFYFYLLSSMPQEYWQSKGTVVLL